MINFIILFSLSCLQISLSSKLANLKNAKQSKNKPTGGNNNSVIPQMIFGLLGQSVLGILGNDQKRKFSPPYKVKNIKPKVAKRKEALFLEARIVMIHPISPITAIEHKYNKNQFLVIF
jgi:hypothetical protein